VAGALAGFLVWYWPPARVFLGDAGSHIVGFLLAAVAAKASVGVGPWASAAILLLLVAVPIFELALLVTVRLRRGDAWWRASNDHLALRLQRRGWTRTHINAAAAVVSQGPRRTSGECA
jgi:UDP-N-acetylmuramyl pentapeptide phosphotransferase/UDP-N-acetylglucosamine-1-phosphate transferase